MMSDQTVPEMDTGTGRPTGTEPPSPRPARESREQKAYRVTAGPRGRVACSPQAGTCRPVVLK